MKFGQFVLIEENMIEFSICLVRAVMQALHFQASLPVPSGFELKLKPRPAFIPVQGNFEVMILIVKEV